MKKDALSIAMIAGAMAAGARIYRGYGAKQEPPKQPRKKQRAKNKSASRTRVQQSKRRKGK